MVHFLFLLARFHFLTAKTVLISFDNLILSIRSRSSAQRFHLSRANQTTLERQFVSAPGHSYYNCNTTKTSVVLPIRA